MSFVLFREGLCWLSSTHRSLNPIERLGFLGWVFHHKLPEDAASRVLVGIQVGDGGPSDVDMTRFEVSFLIQLRCVSSRSEMGWDATVQRRSEIVLPEGVLVLKDERMALLWIIKGGVRCMFMRKGEGDNLVPEFRDYTLVDWTRWES